MFKLLQIKHFYLVIKFLRQKFLSAFTSYPYSRLAHDITLCFTTNARYRQNFVFRS